MFYYLLVIFAILLFGGNYFVSGRYQMRVGSSFLTSMILAVGTGVFGALFLLVTNKFSLHWTPFTLLMAMCFACSSILVNVCTVFSLEKASLSLFSAFTMIGGMIVPSVVGMIFFNEALTWNKAVCYVLTIIGLCLTIKKEKKNKAILSYIGVFFFNGMSAAISTIFSKANFEKAASADYTIFSSLFKIVIAGALLPWAIKVAKDKFEKNEKTDINAKFDLHKYMAPMVLLFIALAGILNNIANFLLPIAMTDGGLDGSVVYPMITGGVMITSTCLGYLNLRKPQKREVVAVIICTFAILFLIVPALIGA